MSAKARKEVASRKRKKTIEQVDRAIAAVTAPEPTEDWTFVEAACGGHVKQSAFVKDAVRKGARTITCSGRQSGKSRAALTACVHVLSQTPDANGIWIGLSGEKVRTTVWPAIKTTLKQWEKAGILPCKVTVSERPMRLTFENGAILTLLGTDDARNADGLRGITAVIAVVDEIQSQPYDLVQQLIEEIIDPAFITTNGPMLVLGTPARKRVGWFAETWFGNNGYKKHTWNGFDSPVTAATFTSFLERLATSRGVDWQTDPKIQREYLGVWTEDSTNAVLPNYSPAKNHYAPIIGAKPTDLGIVRTVNHFHLPMTADGPVGLPAGHWIFSMGIDPGKRDRVAIEVMGWNDVDPRVWQVAEYCIARGHKSPASVWVEYVRLFLKTYGGMQIFLDQSGITTDTLEKDYQIPAVKAAVKVQREDQLARFNDLCSKGWLQMIADSALAEDCAKAEWAPQLSTDQQRAYSKAWKIDPLDAARYSLAGYWNLARPEDKRTDAEKRTDQRQKELQRVVEDAKRQQDAASAPVDFLGDVTPW